LGIERAIAGLRGAEIIGDRVINFTTVFPDGASNSLTGFFRLCAHIDRQNRRAPANTTQSRCR